MPSASGHGMDMDCLSASEQTREPSGILNQLTSWSWNLRPEVNDMDVFYPALRYVRCGVDFQRQVKQITLDLLRLPLWDIIHVQAEQRRCRTKARPSCDTDTVDQHEFLLSGVEPETTANHLGIQRLRLRRAGNDDGLHAGDVGALGEHHAVDDAGDLPAGECLNDGCAVLGFSGDYHGSSDALGNLLRLVDADGEDQRGSNRQITVSLCNSICGSVHGFIQFSRSVVTVPGMHR